MIIHMTPERWKRIEELYHAARVRPTGDRSAFLAEACADDDRLRLNVESLLGESESADDFLAGPVVTIPARLIADFVPESMAGVVLGGYQLQMLIGAGGMGEVYKAHDSTLGREVAIKILSRAFISDPARLARFGGEARMLAALNHPNICAIHGFEEADGIRFLILELVDGDTLAETLANVSGDVSERAGLPVPDALVSGASWMIAGRGTTHTLNKTASAATASHGSHVAALKEPRGAKVIAPTPDGGSSTASMSILASPMSRSRWFGSFTRQRSRRRRTDAGVAAGSADQSGSLSRIFPIMSDTVSPANMPRPVNIS